MSGTRARESEAERHELRVQSQHAENERDRTTRDANNETVRTSGNGTDGKKRSGYRVRVRRKGYPAEPFRIGVVPRHALIVKISCAFRQPSSSRFSTSPNSPLARAEHLVPHRSVPSRFSNA